MEALVLGNIAIDAGSASPHVPISTKFHATTSFINEVNNSSSY